MTLMRDKNPWATPAWMGETTPETAAGAEPEKFTLPAQEIPRDLWTPRDPRPVTRSVKIKRPLRLAAALPIIIVLALLSAFFSWVTVEPLWLALGHGEGGTATVTRCTGDGLTQRCTGELDGLRVSLLGLDSPAIGDKVEVRRVNEASHRAYSGGLFLRWFTGLIMVLLCGAGIALAAGARRYPASQERWAALGTSFAAPLLVTAGFLAAAF
jgi:hypothetical protein